MKLKHKLPLIAQLPHLDIDPVQLGQFQNLIHNLETQFVSVLAANKELCGIHHVLATEAYKNFFQIALTDSSVENREITLEQCEVAHGEFQTDKPVSSMKLKSQLVHDNSPYNEHLYTVKTAVYNDNSQLFNTVFSRFLGQPTRARLVKLEAGTTVAPHIDYDPSYSTRVIIPIISDGDCLNVFWDKGEVKTFILHPGKAYFLNTGYRHAVVNLSKQHRYTILVSVKGTQDIDHLLS